MVIGAKGAGESTWSERAPRMAGVDDRPKRADRPTAPERRGPESTGGLAESDQLDGVDAGGCQQNLQTAPEISRRFGVATRRPHHMRSLIRYVSNLRETRAVLGPLHEDHEQMVTWYGKPFDPLDIDERWTRLRLSTLAAPPLPTRHVGGELSSAPLVTAIVEAQAPRPRFAERRGFACVAHAARFSCVKSRLQNISLSSSPDWRIPQPTTLVDANRLNQIRLPVGSS